MAFAGTDGRDTSGLGQKHGSSCALEPSGEPQSSSICSHISVHLLPGQ